MMASLIGATIFRQSQYVFHLQTMMRFNDPILIRILKNTREVGGKPLSESDWKALLATELPDSTSQAKRPDVTGWYTTAYV